MPPRKSYLHLLSSEYKAASCIQLHGAYSGFTACLRYIRLRVHIPALMALKGNACNNKLLHNQTCLMLTKWSSKAFVGRSFLHALL